MNHKTIHYLKWGLKRLIFFIISGAVAIWIFFWYISGSFLALPEFIGPYFVATQLYMQPVSKEKLFDGMLKGMLHNIGDRHTSYLDKEDFKNLQNMTDGSYTGIGAFVGKNESGEGLVLGFLKGSPAKEAGLEAGDVITAVDDKKARRTNLEDLTAMLRGKANTKVRITVRRHDKELTITVVRKKIIVPSVDSKMLPGTKIGYIAISEFGSKTPEDFKEAYDTLKKEGMEKMIIDLRDNPGGLVQSAQQIGAYLLPKGPLVSVQPRDGSKEVYEIDKRLSNVPYVVLINGNSASASEIIAGAVQDLKTGTVIGTQSYGKGTMQTVIPNLGVGATKVTIAQYKTAKGRMIDGEGITPDIVLPMARNIIPGSPQDIQLQRAISVLDSK